MALDPLEASDDVELISTGSAGSSQKPKKRKKESSNERKSTGQSNKSSKPDESFKSSRKKLKKDKPEEWISPWPRPGLQHVYEEREPQEKLAHLTRFKPRVPSVERAPIASTSTSQLNENLEPAFKAAEPAFDIAQGTPDRRTSDPLTTRLLSSLPSDGIPPFAPHQLPFTSQYAPQSVSEVLGATSKASATFLRDWLRELQLRPTADPSERKVIMRQVNPTAARKRRRRQSFDADASALDDFIVDDSLSYGVPSSPHKSEHGETQDPFNPLTNLILLSGPTSSGKTASVHAAAKELGYAIFEVAPHQSRGYKELLSAVGEVGRNHLVWRTESHKQTKKGGVMDLFNRAQNKKDAKHDTGQGKGKSRESQDAAATSESNGHSNGAQQPSVQQSLILIEEADILFPDDRSHASFWDGVIQVVSNSHRPVILTCNDPTHIPFDRLALQEALEFQRPAAEESIPLLQAVALQQGHILPWPQASQLYQSPFSYENWAPVTTGAKPPANVSSLARGGGDLRHSLMQLQCLASRSSRQGNWESVNSALLLQQEEKRDEGARLSQDLKQLQRAADALSCADAFVTRKEATHRAAMDGSARAPVDQLELEYQHLNVEAASFGVGGLPEYIRDGEMASTMAELSDKVHAALPRASEEDLEQDRAEALARMDHLSMALPVSAPLLTSPAVLRDYGPHLLSITHFDDLHATAFEAAQAAAEGEGGDESFTSQQHEAPKYQTRRSRRLHRGAEREAYSRYLDDLTDAQLEDARKMRKRFQSEAEADQLRVGGQQDKFKDVVDEESQPSSSDGEA